MARSKAATRCRGARHGFRQADRLGIADLVVESERLRAENAVLGEDRHQVFAVAHDERRDARAPGPFHDFRQQTIRLGGLLCGVK